MTKRERALVNAALKWCAADHTPTVHPNDDNYGDGDLRDLMIVACFDLMAERDRPAEHYFQPPPKGPRA